MCGTVCLYTFNRDDTQECIHEICPCRPHFINDLRLLKFLCTFLPPLLFSLGHPVCLPLHFSLCWVWKTNCTKAFVSQC